MKMISRYDMMLAIAMSEFYEKTHVLFIPPNTSYTSMLTRLINEKAVTPVGTQFWKLTEKSWEYLKAQDTKKFAKADADIDAFVNKL